MYPLFELHVPIMFLDERGRRNFQMRIVAPLVFVPRPSPHSHPPQPFSGTNSASYSMPRLYCCCSWSSYLLHARLGSAACSPTPQNPGARIPSYLLLGGWVPAWSSLSLSPTGIADYSMRSVWSLGCPSLVLRNGVSGGRVGFTGLLICCNLQEIFESDHVSQWITLTLSQAPSSHQSHFELAIISSVSLWPAYAPAATSTLMSSVSVVLSTQFSLSRQFNSAADCSSENPKVTSA